MSKQNISFKVDNWIHPVKNVGFADYLFRNHLGATTQESEDNENIVVNTIQKIKHLLIHNKNPI